MKKILTLLFLAAGLSASAQYLPNNEFDKWKTKCGNSTCWQKKYIWSGMSEVESQRPGVEPEGWNGSNINQTYIANVSNADLVTKKEGKTPGSTAVKLVNVLPSSMSSLRAPGFVSLAKPWVYPHTNASQADGGVYGGAAFGNKPDSITVLVKQVQQYKENAHIIAYIWAGTFKSKIGDGQNPSKEVDDADRAVMGRVQGSQSGTLIASCDYEFSSYDNENHTMDWTEISIPLTYTKAGEKITPEKVNVILSAADYWNRGGMHEGNELYVDRVNFVYCHALSALSYNNVPVKGFSEKTLSYDLSDQDYNEKKLAYTQKGVGAKVEKDYNKESAVLTITVKGNDYAANKKSVTVYTVQFRKPPVVTPYTNDLTVNVNGVVSAPQKTSITLTKESDGSHSLSLNNFVLGQGADALPVGNIKLTNLTADGNRYTTDQSILITAGDPGVSGSWYGPDLGLVPVKLEANVDGNGMTATIDIDMTATELQQVIKVVFAPTVNLNAADGISTQAGLANAVFTRHFGEGWNTLCVPFATTAENLSATKAQAFVSCDDEWLRFEKVTELEANKPYLVYFEAASDVTACFGGKMEESKAEAVNFGGFAFQGVYGKGESRHGKLFVVKDAESEKDLYRIAGVESEDLLLPTTAYFTAPAGFTAGSKKIFLEDETNGISGVKTANAPAARGVYTLQGLRLNANGLTDGLPAGVYVVNGRKTVVK